MVAALGDGSVCTGPWTASGEASGWLDSAVRDAEEPSLVLARRVRAARRPARGIQPPTRLAARCRGAD